MKYQLEIDINLPREKMIELFDNPDNMKHWQPGFQSFEHLSGSPGEVGARYKIIYQMGRRTIEMVETITVRSLPEEFAGTYETRGVWNEVRNLFYEKDAFTTRWVTVNEFRVSGFAMKMMVFLMPGAFKKQSYKYMENFKAFAESKA